MKRTALAVFAMALASTLTAHARIGETRAQIDARYGNGKQIRDRLPETVQLEYHSGGFTIDVVFFNDRSVWELFKREDTLITDGDIDRVLNVLAVGRWRWDEKMCCWISPDGTMSASRQPGHPDFLSTKDIEKVKEIEERHKANLDGL